MLRYLARRLAFSVLLVAVVSSAALLLTLAAPGDITSEQVGTGATAAVNRRPSARGSGSTARRLAQYGAWLVARGAPRFRHVADVRPAGGGPGGRARAQHGGARGRGAPALATAGRACPLGVVSGSRRRDRARARIRAASVAGAVAADAGQFAAAGASWPRAPGGCPIGGMTSADAAAAARLAGGGRRPRPPPGRCRRSPSRCPLAATIERLQSQATAEDDGRAVRRGRRRARRAAGPRAVAPRAEARRCGPSRRSSASSSATC